MAILKFKRTRWRGAALLGLMLAGLAVMFLAGCETLKTAKPIVPVREYEKLTVGSFDANYIGTDNCLKACHVHDQLRRDFEASTMGAQLSPQSGLPLVDCESCHGPGSLAVEGIDEVAVKEAAARGETLACKYDSLIKIEELPAGARTLICTRCHTGNATMNLHNWNASPHGMNDVSCNNCHNVHSGPDLIVHPEKTAEMCFQCHQAQSAQFSMPSRHPVKEGRVYCTDCHEPHGTTSPQMFRKENVKATCAQCHAEKSAPNVFEHAENAEDCTNCHSPHGAPNDNLLQVRLPFLCMQCHIGHTAGNGEYYTRCTDCHSRIHGTDVPSASGAGHFIQ